MINLVNRTHAIQVLLDNPVTTSEMEFFGSFTSNNGTVGNFFGNTNSTTEVVMTESDGSNVSKSIGYLVIYNTDTVANVVNVIFLVGTDKYMLHSVSLNAGEKLEYINNVGWVVS